MQPIKAFITGITGFTGYYLAQELTRAGYEVCGLGREGGGTFPWPVVDCDLGDQARLQALLEQQTPDVVVHLAAISFVAHGDARDMYMTNVVGTRNLLAALVASGAKPRSVLVASSANVYGNATPGVINENATPSPANDYAVSKLAMEYMVRLWQDKLPITFVRPFNYTGVGQHEQFLIPKIVKHFKEHAATLELGNLDVFRDFSDVRAVVDAYRRLLASDSAGQVFNICSGQGHALRDILDLMQGLTGHLPEIRVNPVFVRANEVRTLVGSNERLVARIGPMRQIPLRETLQWMLSN